MVAVTVPDILRFTLADPGYPAPLRLLAAPPPVLYAWGRWIPEDAAAVAIVGSRACSIQGQMAAEKLAHDLAAHGLTIVSGLARGIDAAAHRGALRAGGRTIAVLGSGLHRLFPPEHAALAREISGQGAVFSEFPLEMEPLRWNFPRRNRLISGLSVGVIVVEAAGRSGALITATHAAEQGKEVFAMPGPAGAPMSRGAHALLRDGARLVESAEDVLHDLQQELTRCLQGLRGQGPAAPPVPGCSTRARLTPEERPVYAGLSSQPQGVDALTARTGLAAAQLLPLLLGLELKGLARQVPGRQFVRVAP
ncbi:MAG: DNA protecting protein DprA [Omnitrophica WOR_2 bacterium RIFCSPHIGHO2_02_FULL_68_15]|nr:MAG: DNA protecting protein DprA [Omnitrophica WOR_2 bacterium RIFCSPHIGHO2_02_FULL_68_15]